MKRLVAFVLLAGLAAPVDAIPQSLAEVARKEQERRKTLKPSDKVYTNDDLKTDITKTAPSPATPPSTTPAAGNTSPGAPVPSTQVPSVNLPAGKVEDPPVVKDQAYWNARMNTARAALERSRIFADALQSRLNALNTDIVNRDDPAQRAQLELERQRATAELDRVNKEIAAQTMAITEIEDEARKDGVPPGWLRVP